MNAQPTVALCGHCATPMPDRTRRARYCGATCRSAAHRSRVRGPRSVAFPCHADDHTGTSTPRTPTCNVEAVLRDTERCLGCAQRLVGVRFGTRCCSSRCRKRVHRWRRSGLWPRAELLAAAWGIRPRDLWRTPPELFARLHADFHFGLDCASAGDDALCGRWITPEDDALSVSWRDRCPDGAAAFVNPPYSRLGGGLLAWVEKAIEERDVGLPVVMLIPPDPSTRYHQLVRVEAAEERCSRRRLAFLHPDTGVPTAGNRGASMIVPFLPGLRGKATATFLDDPWSPAVAGWLGHRRAA